MGDKWEVRKRAWLAASSCSAGQGWPRGLLCEQHFCPGDAILEKPYFNPVFFKEPVHMG